MSIQVVRAARSDALADHLAETLADGEPDPFAPELVIVPTRGIERFLTQTVADRNGIAANIDFPLPHEFLERLSGSGADPWSPQRLTWPLLRVIQRSVAESAEWSRPLADHLRSTPDWNREERGYSVAVRLARLFGRYALERPGMVAAWEAGRPADVPADLDWQYQLWRELSRAVGHGPLQQAIDASALPPRLFLFGPTRLPERLLHVLRQLGADREVTIYLPVASPTLWDSDRWPAAHRGRGGGRGAAAVRTGDSERDLAVHPLLRSLGRDTRELRLRLGGGGLGLAPPGRQGTLLWDLQDRIRTNTAAPLQDRADDDSLQIHGCHGPTRQVEVLRDAVLAMLERDPGLQPRDIVIMTPDLETYAPLLSAAFGDADKRITDLRLTIADRSKEQHNDVLTALEALLRLLSGRLRRSEVLDFLKQPAVRQRYSLSASDVERLEDLADSSNIRWGVDLDHRERHQLDGIDMGTWSWGLDRMALGAALSERDLVAVGDVLPLPEVGSGDLELVGRLAVVLERLTELADQTRVRNSLRRWVDLLSGAIADFTAARFADSWQTSHALGALEAYVDAAGDAADTVLLSLTEVRHMLAGVLAGRPTRTGFRLGGITACQLEPMRSVPYRAVCLVGMDDGAFPRRASRDGDDVLLREPRIGERDPRSEDRQTFLDAIMAATRHLVITYTANSERTNDPRQPAVPLAELIDLLPRGADAVQTHPLQPFDPRNFEPSSPFGHDEASLAGAIASRRPRTPWSLLHEPLAPVDPPPDRSLASLARFLRQPASTFLEQRLGIRLSRREREVAETVPIDLDPLQRWGLGDRLLRQAITGGDRTAARAAEVLAGSLPPGALGTQTLEDVGGELDEVLAQHAEFCAGATPAAVHGSIDLGRGRTAISIPDVVGTTIVRATYSRPKPGHAIGVWPELLALAAAHPDRTWSARIAAKGGWIELQAPPSDAALSILHRSFALLESCLRMPAPVTEDAGLAYAKARLDGSVGAAEEAAARAWAADRYGPPEAITVAFGPDVAFERMLAQQPLETEVYPGERTRFGALACGLFIPVLRQDPEAGLRPQPKRRGKAS